MNDVLVSIITPTYNSSVYIKETIESVLQQTYQNWEYIIVDDYSTDETMDILKTYAKKDKRIKLIWLKENCGAAIARNKGITIAKGRLIAFVDSDDIWNSDKLKKQVHFMDYKEAALTYTAYCKIDKNGKIISNQIHVPDTVGYNKLLQSNVIGCSTVIMDISKCGKLYMPDIRLNQDHALWLKILKLGFTAHGLDMPLVKYRVTNKSISSNKWAAACFTWKIYRDIEKLKFFSRFFNFANYAIKGFIKYLK